MTEQFIWPDAWILLAIVYTGKEGGDISTIIKVADYINHAIPNDEELKGALARLKRGGVIKEIDGRYKASAKTIRAYTRTHTPRRTALKEVADMENFLGIKKV